MKKKILIHSIVFSPDGVSTAYLYNDIAIKFKESGYDVVVLTTTPHYNLVAEELVKQPLHAKLWGIYYVSEFHNIPVIHIPQKKFKSALLRMLGFIYWHFLSIIIGLLQKNINIILSPSPPLTIGFINLLIGKIKSAKVVYNVQEIYPDFLINQGNLKFKPVINFLKWLERFIYNRSDAVVTIDKVFYNTIVERFINPDKLHVIPNFVDTGLFKPVFNHNLDEVLFPLKDDVLKIMYAGNLGHAQDWEPLLFVAKALSSHNIEFWIIGEGVMKDYLIDQIIKNQLSNVHIIPYQPREHMPALISYADLQFIFMSPEMEGQGFPSKVYTIMACAKPLLITSGINTPISKFLSKVGCACIINQPEFTDKCNDIIAFLIKVRNDASQLTSMGEKGLHLIERSYSKEIVTSQYVDLANHLIRK